MHQPRIEAICYDLPTVSQFFRSVALAVSTQQHTRSEWVEYRDSTVLNAVYAVLSFKTPPGTVEIAQSAAEIDATTDELHIKYLLNWLEKLHTLGPAAANGYITSMLKIRDDAAALVQDLYRDTAAINREIAGETAKAIVRLARIKLGASVGVAALGATAAIVLTPAGAAIASGTSLTYSGSCSLARTWEKGGTAKAVGINLGQSAADFGLGKFAEAREIKALADTAKAKNGIRSAQGVIRKYSQRLGEAGWKKAQNRSAQSRVQRASQVLARDRTALSKAGKAAKVAGAAKVAVPIVFAAIDIWGAWADYDETVKSL